MSRCWIKNHHKNRALPTISPSGGGYIEGGPGYPYHCSQDQPAAQRRYNLYSSCNLFIFLHYSVGLRSFWSSSESNSFKMSLGKVLLCCLIGVALLQLVSSNPRRVRNRRSPSESSSESSEEALPQVAQIQQGGVEGVDGMDSSNLESDSSSLTDSSSDESSASSTTTTTTQVPLPGIVHIRQGRAEGINRGGLSNETDSSSVSDSESLESSEESPMGQRSTERPATNPQRYGQERKCMMAMRLWLKFCQGGRPCDRLEEFLQDCSSTGAQEGTSISP